MVFNIVDFLFGILSAEVSAANLRKGLALLRDRLGRKPIQLEISYEKDGRKFSLKLEARTEKELQETIKSIQDNIDQQ
jgi:hypothetical protein